MSRQTSYRGDGSRDPRRSRGSRHEPPPPLEAPVVLQRSENAWKPATLAGSSKKDLSALDEEEKARIQLEAVLKQCKGLLNKLTVEKFDTISDKILHLDMVNETILGGVIDTIFEKSLDEVNFQSMYARLCSKLSSQLPVIQKWIHSDMKTNTFRRALLAKCQTEFEKGAKWAADEENLTQIRREARKRLDSMTDEEKLKIAEEDFERQRIKRRVLGNIQFIGHLFRESLITEKIMHQCIQQLLANVSEPEEEDLESLSKFLVTIGEKLDHERAKHHMDSYISRITELSTNLKVSSRIRFMLLDVLELRRNGWKGKNAPSGPKTIAEIHQEAAQK
ncbi:armadillo-type protein, partial [Gaertneriomyces semiglobifer]